MHSDRPQTKRSKTSDETARSSGRNRRGLGWLLTQIAAGLLITVGILTVKYLYQSKPVVQARGDFDRRASFQFPFEVSNNTWVTLYSVVPLCNVSLVLADGTIVRDAKLQPEPKSQGTLELNTSRLYTCSADYRSIRPNSMHVAIFVRFEQHIFPGHPWTHTVWVPFHIVVKSAGKEQWISGEVTSGTSNR